MLSGLTHHIPLILRWGSIGAKVVALGMTGFGLSKLWSQEAKQKHRLTARLAFSTTYVLHMGATSVAAAACFGAGPLSAPYATALIATTSLLTSFANVMETYSVHSFLKAKYTALEHQANAYQLDLQRTQAFTDSVNECDTQSNLVIAQLSDLNAFCHQLKEASSLPPQAMNEKLTEIYIALEEKYKDQRNKEEIIGKFFTKIQSTQFNIDTVLNELHDQINHLRTHLSEKQDIFHQKEMTPTPKNQKAKNRLQKSLDAMEQEIKGSEEKMRELGIIHIQCIRFKKIDEHLTRLNNLQANLTKIQMHFFSNTKQIERDFLLDRINTLKATQIDLMHLHETSQTPDLALGLVETLEQRIQEDAYQFRSWLQDNLDHHIQFLENQLQDLKTSAEIVQQSFKTFIRHPIQDIRQQRERIRQIKQEMVDLKSHLTLEKLNEKNRKIKMNLSSVISGIALLLCTIPQGEASNILKPLMLGFGILGSASSLWGFYTKYLLSIKVVDQKQQQTRQLDKEHKFRTDTEQLSLSHPDLEEVLRHSLNHIALQMQESHSEPAPTVTVKAKKVKLPPPPRMLLTRVAKENAKALIANASLTGKNISSTPQLSQITHKKRKTSLSQLN